MALTSRLDRSTAPGTIAPAGVGSGVTAGVGRGVAVAVATGMGIVEIGLAVGVALGAGEQPPTAMAHAMDMARPARRARGLRVVTTGS